MIVADPRDVAIKLPYYLLLCLNYITYSMIVLHKYSESTLQMCLLEMPRFPRVPLPMMAQPDSRECSLITACSRSLANNHCHIYILYVYIYIPLYTYINIMYIYIYLYYIIMYIYMHMLFQHPLSGKPGVWEASRATTKVHIFPIYYIHPPAVLGKTSSISNAVQLRSSFQVKRAI